MVAHSFLHRIAVLFLALTLSTPGALAAAPSQLDLPQPTQAEVKGQESGLFRTSITLRNATDWQRLEQMQVVILQRQEDSALVLVDDEQLETLARLRFEPKTSDELGLLLRAQAPSRAWLLDGLQPLLDQGTTLQARLIAELEGEATKLQRQTLRAAMQALTPEQIAAIGDSFSVDDDADGLTNTQEQWWCTDPLNPDTDSDGRSDGAEIQAIKDWMANRRAGPPGETPWPSWPFNSTTCPDKDHDSIPNLAERWELGLDMDMESTDRDRYDDGQEVFGTTYCPGSGSACGYGQLPSANHDGILLFPHMPSWVKAPGNHPLVAALPRLAFSIVPGADGSDFILQTATVVTTDERHEQGETKLYSTTKTDGTSTSDSETETWENWQEYSKTTEATGRAPDDTIINSTEQRLQVTNVQMNSVTNTSTNVKIKNTINQGGSPSLASQVSAPVTGFIVDEACAEIGCRKYVGTGIRASVRTFGQVVQGTLLGTSDTIQDEFRANNCDPTSLNLGQIWCRVKSAGTLWKKNYDEGLAAATAAEQEARGVLGGNYLQTGPSTLDISRVFPISFPEPRFIPTETNTTGSSTGGARTTTQTTYEEHAVTEGTSHQFGQSWGTATAENSVHAADLWFAYRISNIGLDYARVICNLAINIYIGDPDRPAATYFPGNDLGGNGCFSNFQPGESHTYTFPSQSRVALTLGQMAAIDQGEAVRFVIEDYSLGQDDYYADDAVGDNVQVAVEDGIEDGDEDIDNYLIPTWGDETVLDVLARYFPHTTDESGMLIAIWTPEYNRADTPSWCAKPRVVGAGSQRTLWCKHAISTADWWSIYTNGMGDGSEGFQDTVASPGSVALFRFNTDSDADGYSDRSEERLGTDPYDPTDIPRPELLAGVHSVPTGNQVVATLSLLNTGLYDAYGVEAVMIAPNDTITITNNTVGGSGRVRAQKDVIVGSRILPQTPLPQAWQGANHAKPAVGGYYTGPADRTYTFTVQCPIPGGCSVGSGTWALAWNDGAGANGSLSFGAGYNSPTLQNVGAHGVKLGLLSGTVANGESFTVQAKTPGDTFQYDILSEPYTPPIVLVSYNDPQGNHRFIIPPAAMALSNPTDILMAYAGQMLQDPGVEIVTIEAFASGANTTYLEIHNPTETTLSDAHLFLDFVNISGTVVSEVATTVASLPPGPTVAPVAWDTADFDPPFDADQDYIVMAFWTDYQGNILDTAARPLSSFQEDPMPAFAMASADETWNFGEAQQGTLLTRSFTFANTGFGDLQTYVSAPPELNVTQTGSRRLPSGDATTYEITLKTASLAVGPYSGTITIRSSDPSQPAQTVQVVGTVTAAPADTPVGAVQRPLDWPATFTSGTQGQWVEFMHTLGPTPQTLHPVKVYSQDYVTLRGVGKYATPFSAGTAPADMFGDGRDGVMPTSGNLDNNNGVGVGVVNSGTQGSYYVNVTDVYGVWRVNPGDVVLIHQTQGTGAGCWEINKAVSDFVGGTVTYQLAKPLQCNYASGGNNHAQIQRVPQYTDCPVSGTVTPLAAWNGTWGGIFAVMCMNDSTLSGSINAGGHGFRGAPQNTSNYGGSQGEGALGPGGQSCAANRGGGGGGGSNGYANPPGGAGGGNANTGSPGGLGLNHGGACIAQGGDSLGTADLRNMTFGGGGGSGGDTNSSGTYAGGGGNGGGIAVIFGKSVTISGNLSSDGGNGYTGSSAGQGSNGGGGAGGSILIIGNTVALNTNRVSATPGIGGIYQRPDHEQNGGNGSIGRVRIEYCDSLSGSTNPPASTLKLNCYIAEQVELAPYDRARLNLSASGTNIYQIQYGRRFVFTTAEEQISTLRVPAAAFANASLDALISEVGSGSVTFKLDVGNDGTWDWDTTQNVTSSATLNNAGLAAVFNAYWTSQGAPTTGVLDVPVRVYLSKAGQVLLTNQQVTPTGSKLRHVRLPAQTYSNVVVGLTAGQSGSGSLTVAADVGENGSVEWTWTGSATYPQVLTTANLATAINGYLQGLSGDVDVPIRFYISPFVDVSLQTVTATPAAQSDLSVVAADISFSPPAPVETDTVTVTATVHNLGSLASGPLTASFFATLPDGIEWYIGSAFVPSVPPNSSSSAEIPWNTLGFTGNVPGRVVIDPYNRVAESNETNNQAIKPITILTRPDLRVTVIDLSNDEPVAGEAVDIALTLANSGQTAAPASTLALYDGMPGSGGAPICQSTLATPANGSVNAACAWTPATPGLHRLYAVADEAGVVNESDKSNNAAWVDIYVGFAGPVLLDSGNLPADPPYSPAAGYGVVDLGTPDVVVSCGSSGLPEDTLRRDPGGKLVYRFDHLLPGHFYHLDVTLRECDGNNRQESVFVDGNLVAGPVNLGDSQAHFLSQLLDPALFADHAISVTVEAPPATIYGALVAEVNLHDIDYRYADAGASASRDPQYPGAQGFGWLEGISSSAWGSLPYQNVRINQDGNLLRYRFDGLHVGKRYAVNLTFFQPSGPAFQQRVEIDGQATGLVVNTGDYNVHRERIFVPASAYAGDGSIVVGIVRTNASTGAMVNEISLEELTVRLPDIALSPASITASQAQGAIGSQPLSIDNIGTANLNWTVSEAPSDCAAPANVAWLGINPTSGTTAASSSTALAVSLDARSLAPGSYSAKLCISSNDPDQPLLSVPVALTVTPATNVPRLAIPSNVPGNPYQTVAMPLQFTRNGTNIAVVTFSVDYDQTCLQFDPADSDGDGVPDAVTFGVSGAFQASVTFDAADTDGELDFFIGDTFPPLSVLPDGTPATILFRVICQSPPGNPILARVGFSTDPPTSFGATNGTSVPGVTSDGSVEIQSVRAGDCNADTRVDAGDISAVVLEIFDGDGTNPSGAGGGTFPGSPVGCNANEDATIDAGDISCTVLTIFNGPGACGGMLSLEALDASGRPPALSLLEAKVDGERMTVPIVFTPGDHQISSLAFAIDYDPAVAGIDPTDADGNGIPDVVAFNLSPEFQAATIVDNQVGRLQIMIADVATPLAALPEQVLAQVTWQIKGGAVEAANLQFSDTPAASFGDVVGRAIQGAFTGKPF